MSNSTRRRIGPAHVLLTLTACLLAWLPAALSAIDGENTGLDADSLPIIQDTVQDAAALPDSSQDSPPSLFDETKRALPTGLVRVMVKVPNKQMPSYTFTAYPYPPKPPRVVVSQTPGPLVKPNPLPTNYKDIKSLLLSTGYCSRANKDKPYQSVSWRWLFCYERAVAASGLGEPHSLFSAYQWCDNMVPYMQREIHRSNAIEKNRDKRYEAVLADYEATRADYEALAVRQGISPIEIRPRGRDWTQATIPVGRWWITCTRKAPGVTFYWQVPIVLKANHKCDILFNDANALIITGGW